MGRALLQRGLRAGPQRGGPPAWWGWVRGGPWSSSGRAAGQTFAICGAAQEARELARGCWKPRDSEPPNPQDDPRGGAHRT